MALDISFLSEAMPLWIFALVFVLVYAILAKTKILGGNKWIDSIISIILAIIFTTFTGVREYLANLTPWFAVLLSILFFLFLMVAFMLKSDDWSKFTKPITIVFIILLGVIAIIAIFYTFPATQALLPNAIANHDSDSNNNNNNYCSSDYTKTKVYDYDSYYYKDCEKKGDYYRCDNNENSGTYDRCIKYGSEYRCQDSDNWHYEYKYDNKNCEDNNNDNGNNGNGDIFDNIGNYIYKDKVTNAFWLLLIAIIVAIIITRK